MKPYFDFQVFERFIQDAMSQYERSAPTVSEYLDGLCIRACENPASVALVELLRIRALVDDGVWMQPNYAANFIYKLQHELGQDTTGHAGF